MLRGEYNSMRAIYGISPYLVPTPIAWGTLAQDKNMHFFLCDHHEMDSQVLNIDRFAAMLAELHAKSATFGGMYGFHVSTFIGNLPQYNKATETWEECFSSNFHYFLDLEKNVHGSGDAEFEELSASILMQIIPRLLRPLETDGHSIAPSLLHGDICSSNASTSLHTSGPIIYNACAFYGHNEYDLCEFVTGKLGRGYLDAYQRLIPVSEPKEDFGDRMRLYRLRRLLHLSCLCSSDKCFRQKLKQGMKVLVDRYPNGYGDYLDEERRIQNLLALDEMYDRQLKKTP